MLLSFLSGYENEKKFVGPLTDVTERASIVLESESWKFCPLLF